MGKQANRNTRVKGFQPVRNEAMHAAMVELRRSSAAQRHTLRKFKGTRADRNRMAMRDW